MTPQTELWITALTYGGVFLGVLLAFEGVRQILSRNESGSEARNRRMRMIARGAGTEERLRLLKPDSGGGLLSVLPALNRLPLALRQAGIAIPPKAFVLICLAAFMVVSVLAAATVGPVPGLALGLAIGILSPIVVVQQRRRARTELLVRQLPDALDLMARALRVGHPLNTTITSVAHDMPDPIATEFGIMVDQIAFGDTLTDAFNDFAERYDAEDIRYLAVSVGIQHGTGGDLAQILNTLAKVIRDRLSLRKRIRAISAEGRLTSLFLSFLPLLILGTTTITAPGYYWDVSDDPLFRPFAIIVVVLTVTHFLAMRRLVNFHI